MTDHPLVSEASRPDAARGPAPLPDAGPPAGQRAGTWPRIWRPTWPRAWTVGRSRSLRTTLTLAFLGAAACTVLAATVGILAVRDLGSTVTGEVRERQEILVAVQELVQQVQALTSAAPLLAAAGDPATHAGEVERLQAAVPPLRRGLAELEALGADTEALARIDAAAERLIDNLDRLDGLVARRLALDAAVRAAGIRLRSRHPQVVEMLLRSADAPASLPGPGSAITGPPAPGAVAQDVARLQAAVAGLTALERLAVAAEITGADQLDATARDFAAALSRFQDTLRRGGTPSPALLTLAGTLTETGLGADGVFAQRAALLTHNAEIHGLLAQNAALADALGSAGAAFISAARSDAAQTQIALDRRLAGLSWTLVLIAMGAVGGVLVLSAWIARGVTRRVDALRISMEAQAAGHDVPIPATGRDELGAMAGALERFVAQRSAAIAALDQLNQQKSRFFSIVAHDLRGPLSVVLGYAELLNAAARSLNESQKIQAANAVHRSTRQVCALLEDLLEWGQLQMDRVAMQPERLPVDLLAREVLEVLREAAERRGVTLEVVPGTAVVRADRAMLATILRNLVGNALRFTPKGGLVSIGAKPAEPGWITIWVADTGSGMDRETADALFRLDAPPRPAGAGGPDGGSGLGLLIVKEMVTRHNGRASVETAPDRGTTIRVTLPAG